jgi:general stress protein YciG
LSDKPEKPMSVTEAGKLGGARVKEKYGREFYEAIGRKGGLATKARHPEQFLEMAALGGKKGGQATKERYGADFFARIGTKGGARVKALIAAGKAAESAAQEAPTNAGAAPNAGEEGM